MFLDTLDLAEGPTSRRRRRGGGRRLRQAPKLHNSEKSDHAVNNVVAAKRVYHLAVMERRLFGGLRGGF